MAGTSDAAMVDEEVDSGPVLGPQEPSLVLQTTTPGTCLIVVVPSIEVAFGNDMWWSVPYGISKEIYAQRDLRHQSHPHSHRHRHRHSQHRRPHPRPHTHRHHFVDEPHLLHILIGPCACRSSLAAKASKGQVPMNRAPVPRSLGQDSSHELRGSSPSSSSRTP